MSYALGSWGKSADDDTYTAPVYESGTNACAYWMKVEPMELKNVKVWRVSAEKVASDGSRERVMTALKISPVMGKGYAERWVQEL